MNYEIKENELFLSGKISLSDVSAFNEVVSQYITQCEEEVILNLRNVHTLELNALQLLVSAKKSARKENKTIRISAVHQNLYDTFILSGMNSLFNLQLD